MESAIFREAVSTEVTFLRLVALETKGKPEEGV
jgi:hypothetical protein